jgi:hypothetical protein
MTQTIEKATVASVLQKCYDHLIKSSNITHLGSLIAENYGLTPQFIRGEQKVADTYKISADLLAQTVSHLGIALETKPTDQRSDTKEATLDVVLDEHEMFYHEYEL